MPETIDRIPVIAPEEALRFFREKGLAASFDWRDVFQEEHAHAFTVAKGMTRDVLETIRAAVDAAIKEGLTIDQFRERLQPLLEQQGWWGKRVMADPLTGELQTVQLGSPRRLRTIFDVNLRSAYAAGRWQRVEQTKSAFPYLRYVQIKRPTERPEHALWHGTVLPVDHPWIDQHYPPCGWGCECRMMQVSERQLKRHGWTVGPVPPSLPARKWRNPRTGETVVIEGGIDPGFGFNVGKARSAGITARALMQPIDTSTATEAPAAEATVGAFLNVFGFGPDGAIFTDAGGWPVPIGPAMFSDAAGQQVNVFDTTADAARAAKTISTPTEIRWVWRKGADGRAQMIRRYVSSAAIVDIGRAGWSFALVSDKDIDAYRIGEIAWAA